jgi:hypothetical protein
VLIGYSRRREHNENICGQVKSAEQRFSLWQKYRWRRRYNMSGVAEKPKPPRPPSRFSAQPRGSGGRGARSHCCAGAARAEGASVTNVETATVPAQRIEDARERALGAHAAPHRRLPDVGGSSASHD